MPWHRKRARGPMLPLLSLTAGAIATATDPASADSTSSADPLLLAMPGGPFPRLVGGSSLGGGRPATGPNGGPLLAVESGVAITLGSRDDPAQDAWAFGARVGWALPNGLAAHLRYDDLGVQPDRSPSPLQLATAGLRYSVPFLVPLPFAEVDAGPAFTNGDVHFGASAALGASLPLGAYLLVDATAHDWLVPIGGTLRQTLTIGLGLTVTFASPMR